VHTCVHVCVCLCVKVRCNCDVICFLCIKYLSQKHWFICVIHFISICLKSGYTYICKFDAHKLNSGIYLTGSHHRIFFINLWAVIFKIYCFIVFVSWYTFTVESCMLCWHWLTSCRVIFLQICHAVKSQGYVPVRDPEGRIGPYAYKGNQWVSYDDVSDIRRKVCAVHILSFLQGCNYGMWHCIAVWVVADVLKESPW
jgi:Glycosyl hydrolases family 18.